MKLIATHLQTDVALPRPVRNWLSELLTNGALQNVKGDRLIWTAAAVRPPAYLREADEFAHVYALMEWGWSQDDAAQAVANLFAGKDIDSAATKKRVNKAKTRWKPEGPFRQTRPDGEPPEATEQHLCNGEKVIVELHASSRREAGTLAIWIKREVLDSAVSTRRK